jgi:gamma-glutamyltranspeptidase/glutathione hydrolase
MYLDSTGALTEKSLTGALAAGVPGAVAGLYEAHRKLGSRPGPSWCSRPSLSPRRGFPVDWAFRDDGDSTAASAWPRLGQRRALLRDGKYVAIGDTWRAPELGAVLRASPSGAATASYKGETADRIVAGMKRSGGIISKEDLAGYTPIWRTPVEFDYRGHTSYRCRLPRRGDSRWR